MSSERQRPPSSLSAEYWVGPIDLRPLGLFRIVFGYFAFCAVANLAPVLRDLLSDEGVMPRFALVSGIARFNRFSIFDLAGPLWVTWALYLMTLVALAAFVVGYRTRLASIASFFLVTGLHERNLLVFDGADNVIRVMLFWSMFMDAGGRYSVDALLRARAGLARRETGWALPARMAQLQIAWIYLSTVIWKLQGQYWGQGTALRFALGLDHLFTRPLGARLFNVAWFIVPASYATLAVEGAFAFLVLAPFGQPLLKGLGLASALGLHAGIWVLMNVGNFSYVMPATYALFFEPDWAERAVGFSARAARVVLGPARVTKLAALGQAILAKLPPPGPDAERFPALWQAARQLAVPVFGCVIASCVWFSFPEKLAVKLPGGRAIDVKMLAMPGWLHEAVQESEVWQSWDMFAPDPMNTNSWLKGEGKLSDGTEVDALRGNRGGPLPSIFPHFYFSRWTKITNSLAYGEQAPLLNFGKFICREWNTRPPNHRSPLKEFKIYRVERRTPELGKPPPDWSDVLIWEHRCF